MSESMKEKTRRLERIVKGKNVGKTDTFVFSEVRKMIELAITEEREVSGWQPIETAPKDGETAILGYQAITGGLWVIAPMYFTEGTWRIVQFHDDNIEHSMRPSHWQHLPAAPKAEVSE